MCQKKELRKVEKEMLKDQLVYVHKCWKFSYQVVQLVCYSCWCKILVGSDHKTCIPIILLVCINFEISLRMCVIDLHLSYLLVSTRQRTFSLNCYLTLQQLEFRLYSLYIISHQAPHKSHRNRYSSLVFALPSLSVTTTYLFLCNPQGIHKIFGWYERWGCESYQKFFIYIT